MATSPTGTSMSTTPTTTVTSSTSSAVLSPPLSANPDSQTEPATLPPNVITLQRTAQLDVLYTIIRDKNTGRGDFIFYSDRIIRLLVRFSFLSLLFPPFFSFSLSFFLVFPFTVVSHLRIRPSFFFSFPLPLPPKLARTYLRFFLGCVCDRSKRV